MSVTLNKAILGKKYKIVGFYGSVPSYEKERLISFGFIEGFDVKVARKSISKRTMQVNLNSCSLILRSKDACKIIVEEMQG